MHVAQAKLPMSQHYTFEASFPAKQLYPAPAPYISGFFDTSKTVPLIAT